MGLRDYGTLRLWDTAALPDLHVIVGDKEEAEEGCMGRQNYAS